SGATIRPARLLRLWGSGPAPRAAGPKSSITNVGRRGGAGWIALRWPSLLDTSQRIYVYLRLVALRRKLYTFWIDGDLAQGLKAVKERDGISESEQIRRAIRTGL